MGANKGEIDVGETDRLVSAEANLGGDERHVFRLEGPASSPYDRF